jgi:hypothetical protein
MTSDWTPVCFDGKILFLSPQGFSGEGLPQEIAWRGRRQTLRHVDVRACGRDR